MAFRKIRQKVAEVRIRICITVTHLLLILLTSACNNYVAIAILRFLALGQLKLPRMDIHFTYFAPLFG